MQLETASLSLFSSSFAQMDDNFCPRDAFQRVFAVVVEVVVGRIGLDWIELASVRLLVVLFHQISGFWFTYTCSHSASSHSLPLLFSRSSLTAESIFSAGRRERVSLRDKISGDGASRWLSGKSESRRSLVVEMAQFPPHPRSPPLSFLQTWQPKDSLSILRPASRTTKSSS